MENLKQSLTGGSIKEFIRLEPVENPDWQFARNRRCVLMVPSAEWVQSVFSCQLECGDKRLIIPNRDYPYEGLLVYQDGENWKFIDGIGLGVKNKEGLFLPISAVEVKANPWQMTYCYNVSIPGNQTTGLMDIPFSMTYFLDSNNTPDIISGCIELDFPPGTGHPMQALTPVIQPFIDIRHMYAESDFSSYKWWSEDGPGGEKQLHIDNYNRRLTFCSNMPPAVFDRPEMQHWQYKLGTGSRMGPGADGNPNNPTAFRGEEKQVASLFNLPIPPSFNGRFFRLYFNCRLVKNPRSQFIFGFEKNFIKSREDDLRLYNHLNRYFGDTGAADLKDSLTARAVGLQKFKTYIRLPGESEPDRCVNVPHAGAWWFRTVWFRDVFEGILNSFQTLMDLPGERENIKYITLLALREGNRETGLILNRIPEFKHLDRSFNNSDGTLLCYIAANTYIRHTRDSEFAKEVLFFASNTISRFREAELDSFETVSIDGAPRVEKNSGLLLSVPYHSWIDTRNLVVDIESHHFTGLPNRGSGDFVRALYRRLTHKQDLAALMASPHFFLPEINAMWITFLEGTLETIGFVLEQTPTPGIDRKEIENQGTVIRQILSRASKHYKKVFWNPAKGFLYNIVYGMGREAIKDGLECEAAVTAAALLGEKAGGKILKKKELAAVWKCARQALLVNRRLNRFGDSVMPFGILTRNQNEGVYYDDRQYHSDVVWLKSTPYLIKLLRLTGEHEWVNKILLNTLDHQMSEGAIFYNHELFSKPGGDNPWPATETSANPVPMKNPIQFWSQWCDPYLAFLKKKKKRRNK